MILIMIMLSKSYRKKTVRFVLTAQFMKEGAKCAISLKVFDNPVGSSLVNISNLRLYYSDSKCTALYNIQGIRQYTVQIAISSQKQLHSGFIDFQPEGYPVGLYEINNTDAIFQYDSSITTK